MKCGGMIAPLASLTKPESIGCWISACTSVVSPLEIARTRMVDVILDAPVSSGLAAAAADRNLDFLGLAVELPPRFHHPDPVGGLRHFQAIGNARHGPGRNF